jgi:hypothetical protein
MSNIRTLTSKLSQLNLIWDASAAEKSSSSASKLPTKGSSSPTTATSGVSKASPNDVAKSVGVANEQPDESSRASVATIRAPAAKTTGPSKETQRPALTRHDTLATAPVQEEGDDGAAVAFADIGTYDGELENDRRGSEVTGDAAEELALDSSISK